MTIKKTTYSTLMCKKIRILKILFLVLSCLLLSVNQIYAQDSDGDGTLDNLDFDAENDGIPNNLDGCSTIDIANTIGIGSPIVTNSSYPIEETTITYTTTHIDAFYGYVAGNQGDAIRFQGPANDQLELSFSTDIQNVTFKLTDFDLDEKVTVNAYDEFNNLISLAAINVPFIGSNPTQTGNLIEAIGTVESDGDDEADDGVGGVHFYFPDKVSRIVFIFNAAGGESLRLTEINYCLIDTDNDGILDFQDIDSDNDAIPDIVEAGGVDTDGDGVADDITDNNGNGVPDIYDYRCTNDPAASGWATSVHASTNTSNTNDALGSGLFSYADIGVGGSLELRFSDIIPAGNNITVRHVILSGSGQLPFTVERSSDGISYSNAENFLTSFDGYYAVLSYQVLGGNTEYIKITNLSTETLGIDYAKYNFGLGADCLGIYGVQISMYDTDNDGIPNFQDLDSDGDGIFDVVEALLPDFDTNGLADGYVDSDSDGYNDNFDGDVGNDGTAENTISAVLLTATDTNADGIPESYFDANADALGLPNPYDIDADDDGIPDNIEGQPTIGYIVPLGTVNSNGLNTAYLSGITPEDTDGDGVFDFLDSDSDNDGLPDIQENGMANVILSVDTDDDGLDNNFEGGNLNDLDVNDEINDPLASVLPDADSDVLIDGDLDYRDLFDTNPPASATLDFDGVDDYLSTPVFIDGLDEVSIMAWVKSDLGNSTDMTIAGEDRGCKLWLQDGNKPTFSITTVGNPMRSVVSGVIKLNEWHHISGTYSNTTGILKIYLDGQLASQFDTGTTGLQIENTASGNGSFEVGRYSRNIANKEYFKGEIDEVRVFDNELTEDQIQRIVYQEIEDNAGNVRGSVIPKDIVDINTNNNISWSNLIAYYPMTDIRNSTTSDFSSYSKVLLLNNITTVQGQTAPMPYESTADGDWTAESTWLYGDVWDIENEINNKDWSIVKINNNVTTSSSHTQLGMIVENSKTLTVNGDNEINNTWYLELNGTMDLADESQLLQNKNSDLVTSVGGNLLRRQKGSSNVYWYTYMSSPVGAIAATSLIDNNTTSNNPNNTAFTFNTLKEGNGSAVQFTSAYNEIGKLSTRWMYTYLNGITYFDWAHYTAATALNPGVGYIHKGTGNEGLDQEYLFEGKPNNGTILIAADDVDGDSGNESQPDVTQTSSLIGNPYPSAIDAHQFINDNAGTISGTLYFWHQWSGNSHNIAEYEGGYATVNLMSKIRAYQFVDLSGADNGSQDGALTPKQYIAVGQSFLTEVIADGEIEFNNSQRVFKREGIGESEFFRTTENTSVDNGEDPIQIMKLEFKTSNDMSREIALGFSEFTTAGFDYGYDGEMFDDKQDDIYTYFEGKKMITQAYPIIISKTRIPLGLNATGNYIYSIRAIDFIGFNDVQNVYLKDNLKGTYFDLRSDQAYRFKSESGQFNDRFEIVFKKYVTPVKKEVEDDNTVIYFNTNSDRLFVKGLNTNARQLTLLNTLGQGIKAFSNVSTQRLEDGLPLTNFSSGIYMVRLTTATNQIIDKKIIID